MSLLVCSFTGQGKTTTVLVHQVVSLFGNILFRYVVFVESDVTTAAMQAQLPGSASSVKKSVKELVLRKTGLPAGDKP